MHQLYWYEVSTLQKDTDEYRKALRYLCYLCHSLIIRCNSPLHAAGPDRGIIYLIIFNLANGKETDTAEYGWEKIIASLIKKAADELVYEQKFESSIAFYKTLENAIKSLKNSDARLKFFNLKIKKLCAVAA